MPQRSRKQKNENPRQLTFVQAIYKKDIETFGFEDYERSNDKHLQGYEHSDIQRITLPSSVVDVKTLRHFVSGYTNYFHQVS